MTRYFTYINPHNYDCADDYYEALGERFDAYEAERQASDDECSEPSDD